MKITKKIKDKQLEILEKTYAGAVPELIFNSSFELLISVILSAQCTDKRVNAVTAVLFKIANTPEQFLKLGQEKLEELIKSCGFYRMKSKNILAACEMLVKNYDGEVPDNFDELVKLPGVGRKTANVVTSVAFKTPAIAVDTHVFRISNRLQLAVGDTPLDIELGLQKVIPREKWSDAHHWLIWHGRKICKARLPLCTQCPLNEVCPSASTNNLKK